MKLLSDDSAKLARILLLVASVISIPALCLATVFENAGGGTQRLRYLLFPFICILAYFCYVLNKRRSDKDKNLRSTLPLIVSEFIIGLTALTVGSLAMYAMITWSFEIQIFIILAVLIYFSIIVLLDSLEDLKNRKKTIE